MSEPQRDVPGSPVGRGAAAMVTGRRRRILGLLAAAALTTSGCFYQHQTRTTGATGITVDGSGHPAIVVAVCAPAQIENVYLYDAAQNESPATALGSWQTERVSQAAATVAVLTPPSSQWTVSRSPGRLDPAARYRALGESTDANWQTTPFDFSAADLGRVTAGTVLYGKGVTGLADFYRTVCQS